ncbi:MAG: hypothetical protein V4615_03425 [Bacteroidota bacterium]
MKTNKNKTVAAIMLVAVIMATSSCQKEKLTKTVKNSKSIENVGESFSDIQRTIMFEVARNLSYKTENCGIVTDDTVSVPHVRTIDYGTGCTDDKGNVRKGQMVITYDTDDFLTVSGANSYTTFNNFSLDDEQVTGSFNIHNNGTNGNGNYTFTTIGKYDHVMLDGEVVSIEGQYDIEWTAGANTTDLSDNEFTHTGSVSATTTISSDMVTISIVQPLLEKNSCPGYFVSGEEHLQITSEPDAYRNYGDGTCDNLAVETVNGVPTQVTLD